MNAGWLRNQPIERKLLLLTLLTAGLALALAALGFLGFQWWRVEDDARQVAQNKVEFIAANLAAAFEAGDGMGETNILQSLKANPQYRSVTGYLIKDSVQVPIGVPQGTAPRSVGVAVSRIVPIKGNRVVVISLSCPISANYGPLIESVLILLLIIAAALLAAVRLSRGMRRSLSLPIQNLWRATRLVAGGAQPAGSDPGQAVDELTQLVEDFNGVMTQLQNREAALAKAQGDLEGRVVERTRELQQEIQQRRRVEAALADEKERLAVTLRSIGDGVVATDRRGHIVLFNTVAEELTGWSSAEALGRPLREVLRLFHEKTREACEDPVDQVLRSDGPIELSDNIVLIARNGTERLIGDSGAPIRDRDAKSIGVVLVFRDVTERQRVADELLKAGKLESIGMMAGGIAHDFNNILTSVLGHVSLAKLNAESDSDLMASLSAAENYVMKARELTRQLLAFAKGGAPLKRTAALAGLISEYTNFALHGSNVRPRLSLAEDLWPAEVDAGQFRQVIQSLVLHGVRAMPNGGVLEVRAANVALSEPSWIPLPPGNYVMISIQDHGQGIAPGDMSKIFDPYFTKDGGSGLGLAAAYAIVKRHDGHVAVESKEGKGTAFHVYLPASSGEPTAPTLASLPGQRRRILLMDDDAAIREVACEMLHTLGYDVEAVEEGGAAIESYRAARSAGRPYDTVILDLTVQGGMGGQDTIQELLRLDKNVKAIVSSGYYDDPVLARYREYGFTGAVPKPYTLEELERVLRELLNAGARDSNSRQPSRTGQS